MKRAKASSNGSGTSGPRIPADVAFRTFRHLRQTGELDVILGVLQDDGDMLQRKIGLLLGKVVVTDPKQLAELNMLQGMLGKTQQLLRSFSTLAQPR